VGISLVGVVLSAHSLAPCCHSFFAGSDSMRVSSLVATLVDVMGLVIYFTMASISIILR
jgi:hypothetical protein